MVRLFHAYFPTRTLLLCMSELLLVLVSMIIGTVVSTGLADADLALMYEGGLMKIALITGVVFVWMYYFDLYDTNVLGNRREVFTRITQVFGATCASLAAIYYVFPESQLAMRVLGTGSVFIVIAWTAGRKLFLQVNTVSYFAPQYHAGKISAPVLVAAGDNNAVNGPEWLTGLVNSFAGNAELYQLTHEGQRDRDAMDVWLSETMAVEPRPRIWEISR